MTDYMKEAERLLAEHEQAAGLCSYADCQTTRAALLAHIQRGAAPEGNDGKRVLREVFALCEDTEAKCYEDPSDFNRGRSFEAKGIARAIGAWYQEEFCGRTHMGEPAAPDHFRDAAKMVAVQPRVETFDVDFLARLGAEVPASAEVPMPEPDGTAEANIKPLPGGGYQTGYVDAWSEPLMRTYGAACRSAGEAAGYERGLNERNAGDETLAREIDLVMSDDGVTLTPGAFRALGFVRAALRGEVK